MQASFLGADGKIGAPSASGGASGGAASSSVALEGDVLALEPPTDDPMALLVWSRRGAVLGKRTILKKEWFAPTSRVERALNVDGMSNFRHVRDTPLSATAQPSVAGIRAILDFLGAHGSTTKSSEHSGDHKLPPPLSFPNRTASVGTIGVTPLLDLGSGSGSGSGSGQTVKIAVDAPPAQPSQGSASALAAALTGGNGSPPLAPVSVFVSPLPPATSGGEGRSGHNRRTSYVFKTPTTTQRIVWVNLREEPVVYIGSNAYLLRDTTHPYRPMPEFGGGMTPDRSEKIEERLRDDIIKEATENGDRILIHEQVSNSEVRPKWLPVAPTPAVAGSTESTASGSKPPLSHPQSSGGTSGGHRVRTPRQVFSDLSKDDGYAVSYHRIPLYVEEAPGFRSFDRLMRLLTNEIRPDTQIVFNCQR